MAGKALARYLLSKGRSQAEIEKKLGIGYRRTKTLINAANDDTDTNTLEIVAGSSEFVACQIKKQILSPLAYFMLAYGHLPKQY